MGINITFLYKIILWLIIPPVEPVEDLQADGPYLFYKDDKIFVSYIREKSGLKSTRLDSFRMAEKKNITLQVATDQPGETFTLTLKTKLTNEKSDYGKVDRMFMVSDIEANFKAFRTLLQANGIIDEKFNWTFGTGHLVLTGDFFDRGSQQTEVLWLIYALEEKAKAAKGYVHFILGNHEIMNMSGDFRYVHPRYMEHAELLKQDYLNLYWDHSELGRWLRTKNIAEKINNILFVHGGISSYVNYMGLPTGPINDMARPFYPDTSYNYPDPQVELLFSEYGPMWYRGYYTGKVRATQAQVDSTLALFNAKYIVTGHTIIADTISVLYQGKVFNTDVYHTKGSSEGLLYEGNAFYRVNALGEKKRIR